MTPSDSGIDQFVERYVREHYSDSSSPLMLAQLGKAIKDEGYTIPNSLSLKQYIERAFGAALPIIQDPDVPASIAVTLPKNQADIESHFLSLSKPARTGDALERLPRALLIAFCRHLPPGRRIFMRVSPPLRYHLADETPPSGPYLEIPPEYRLPGEQVYDVRSLPQQKKVELRERIDRWFHANDLTWETFTIHDPSAKSQLRPTDGNALARLLAAQSADVRAKILIPGDIALLLMSRS